jgi:membrane associated rhomboid family serine protease
MIPVADIIPSRTRPLVTISLIVVNTAVFLVQASLSPSGDERMTPTLGLVPASFSAATVLTSMFLHGSILQIGGNMLYLWLFGDNVEDRLGHGRFLIFYLAAGTVSAVVQTALDPASTLPVVGATGAVAGVVGGYFVLYPQSRVLTLFPFPLLLFEVPAFFFLGLWFLAQFLSGIASLATQSGGEIPVGVAFWAHLTGLVTGGVLVRLLQRPERQRVEWWSP